MESARECCENCGSTRIVAGRIEDASFKVKIPFARLVLSDCVTMNATACLDCGSIKLRVDPLKLNSILGNAREEQNG